MVDTIEMIGDFNTSINENVSFIKELHQLEYEICDNDSPIMIKEAINDAYKVFSIFIKNSSKSLSTYHSNLTKMISIVFNRVRKSTLNNTFVDNDLRINGYTYTIKNILDEKLILEDFLKFKDIIIRAVIGEDLSIYKDFLKSITTPYNFSKYIFLNIKDTQNFDPFAEFRNGSNDTTDILYKSKDIKKIWDKFSTTNTLNGILSSVSSMNMFIKSILSRMDSIVTNVNKLYPKGDLTEFEVSKQLVEYSIALYNFCANIYLHYTQAIVQSISDDGYIIIASSEKKL